MDDIFIKRHNILQFGQRSIRYTGTKSWNNITLNSKQSPSVKSFRHHLNLHLFSTKYHG